MESNIRNSTYAPGFDTPSHSPPNNSDHGLSLLRSPSHALGRLPSIHDFHDRSSTTLIGGILDSPLIQLKGRKAMIPLSPPPTEPTTQATLPPLLDTQRYSNLSFDDHNHDGYDGHNDLGLVKSTSARPSWTYSPPLSPVGTSPSFTSLSLSYLSPSIGCHATCPDERSLVSPASPPLSSHSPSVSSPAHDAKVLLSPLSPEWGEDFVEEEDGPVSIDAVLSSRNGVGRVKEQGGANEELDGLGLADDEDGSSGFAFSGFLNRGSKPRLSMLEIPPSAYPTTTLSPSSYYPSAASATASSLWRVDETPTATSSLWHQDQDSRWGCVEEQDDGSLPDDPPGGEISDGTPHLFNEPYIPESSPPSSTFSHLGSSSPRTGNLDLLPSTFDDSFDAYSSPRLQSASLPGLLSSPRVHSFDLPDDDFGVSLWEPPRGKLGGDQTALLLNSNESTSGDAWDGTDPETILPLCDAASASHCNQDELSKLSTLLQRSQAAENEARAQEHEALSAIAIRRSPASRSRLSSSLLEVSKLALPASPPNVSASTPASAISSSMSIAELQKVAADARRAAKKARSRAKEVSALLRLKLDEVPSSTSDTLLLTSPTDPLLDSPSPPMLFEPLDDTAAVTSSPTTVSPPLSTFNMEVFATSPPIFSSSNKSLSRKRNGGAKAGVDHLVSKMILNRREAGSTSAAASTQSPSSSANAKAVFLSPLLGHNHQLQLRQRYKFLRSSPLARNVVNFTPQSHFSSLSTTPLPSSLVLDSLENSANGPSRSNSLDSTASTDTACSSSSSTWSEWGSDGETSFGEDDLDDLDDDDVEMGFQALKTPLMWGMDLGLDGGFEKTTTFGDEGGEEEGGKRGLLLPAL